MGATRNVALSELNLRGISINAATNSIDVVASDSGVIFVNKNTTNDTTYELPAVADAAGKMWGFFQGQTTKNMIINAPEGTMLMDDDLTSNSATTYTNNCGFAAWVIGDGSWYYFFEIMGLWNNA